MANRTCSVPDCGNPVKNMGFCYSHYMKNWRYGTPTPQFAPKWADIRGKRYGTLIVRARSGRQWLCDCDCGRSRLASAGELNREGDSSTCGERRNHRSNNAGYTAAHDRCRRDRGSAKSHRCVDCGCPAKHWSYNHDDPDEREAFGLSDGPIAYSLSPDHYSPRCVPCHKMFDLGRLNSAKCGD